MRHNTLPAKVFLVLLYITLGGCSTTLLADRDISSYRNQVEELKRRILTNPDDAGALQELGAIYVTTGFFAPGRELLEQALETAPENPRTRFYLGAAYEALSDSLDDPDSEDLDRKALLMYENHASAPDPYGRLMRGRYYARSRALARREVRAVQKAERDLGEGFLSTAGNLSSTTVGVYALDYQGTDDLYRPLGRGLSEMMTIDFSKIDRLTVVERVRLQALLDEQALAATEQFDPATAPRRGLLAGAGTVVGGTFNIMDDSRAEMNVIPMDVVSGSTPEAVSRAGDLERLFQMEKEVVRGVLDEMGIELTDEETARIQRFPTRNLLAFLAYSRGLIQEDGQRFEAAAASFRQAVALDPGFDLAAESAADAESVSGMGGGPGGGLGAVLGLDLQPDIGISGFQSIVDIRLRNEGESIDISIVPGPEQRDGTIEYLLPPPPPPPPPPNNQP